MAQVISNYPAPLPTPPASPVTMAKPTGKLLKKKPSTSGYLGKLTQAQEAKLRAVWAIAYKFVEMCEAEESFDEAVTLEDKFVPPARKPGAHAGAGRKKKSKGSLTHQRHPTLVNELMSLLPPDERNPEKLARDSVEALDYWTPHMFRIVILHVVKQEHPDELVLRYLRLCNWDIIKACKSMGQSIYWRTMEVAVDDDIMRLGEGGAAEDEKNGQGHARVLGAEFMKILRSGRGFLHGNDREGRPITYMRARLHKPGEFSPESMERYIIYLLEMARLSLISPVETGVLFVDMSGFRLSNLDLKPLKFILQCTEMYYPESVGLIIVHKAPFGSNVLWKLIRRWVNKSISDKVKFTRNAKDLSKYINISQILREHGGQDDYKYEYEEPSMDENFKMQNTITRNYLLLERQMLAEQFEDVTKEWVMNAQGTERCLEVSGRRDKVCADLATNFWELDPYVRARSLYDRRGCLSSTGNLQYHPPKSALRRTDSVATRTQSLSAESSSAGRSSSSAARMSMTRSSVLGYSSSSNGSGPAGARSSMSGAPSGYSGTLYTCSILGSPVKEEEMFAGELENFDSTVIGDDSSYYSD